MSAEAPSQTNTFPVVTTAILVVLTVVFGLELVLGATPPTGFLLAPSTRTLRSLGALSPTSIQAAGEWWRVLTTVFLHADLSHLFFNAIVLFGAGYMLEMLIGRAWLIALFLLGGISGSLLSLAVDSADRTEVGASGAIMALLAVLVVVSFHLQGWENRFRLQLASLRFLIPSLVPLGTTGGEQIAYAAHIGGALGGGVMGLGVLALWPREDERPRIGTFVGALTICGTLGVLASALPPLVKHHLSGVDALYEQSVVDSRDNRTDDAIASLTRAIALDTKDAILYYARALAYSKKKDNDRAIPDFDTAIGLNANDPWFFRERALAYEGKRDFDRAIADYSEAIRLTLKRASASKNDMAGLFNDRGVAYRRKGDTDGAIADYTEALRRDPDYLLAYGNRGLAHGSKGDTEKAIADYTQAIRVDPKKWTYFYNRALAYRTRKQYDEAIADFTQTIRLDEKDADNFRQRALTWEYKGDLDKSIEDYTQAIALKPDYSVAFNDRGVAWSKKGDKDKAFADYTDAIRIDPGFALAYNNRGLIYRSKGDLEHAVMDFGEAVRIDANYSDARDNLAKARDALARGTKTPR